MKTCATCRYMAAERNQLSSCDSDHRSCVRIIHGNGMAADDGEHGDIRKQPAAVLDGSGYAARLVVLPTFGCVLHEERAS